MTESPEPTGATPPTFDLGLDVTVPDGDVLTRKQAAEACRVSLRTVSRWLVAGQLSGAYQDANDVWHIPVTAVVPHLPKKAPGEKTPKPTALDEVAELRAQVADLLRRAEVAEAIAKERGESLADARLALRALTAGDHSDARPHDDDAPRRDDREHVSRRRWWSRS